MSTITVLGATGFAGSAVVREALDRQHDVTLVSRSTPQIEGGRIVQGSVLEAKILDEALTDADGNAVDVVVGALSPRGDMVGRVKEAYAKVAERLAGTSTRFIIVGGFGSMLAEDGSRIAQGDDFPEAFKSEATELYSVLELLRETEKLNWTYVSPAANFGAYISDQTRRGSYRSGTDVPFYDENGVSAISGSDYAIGIVDEIERGDHNREHISFAY